jgi:cytochrome c oxidase subunit 4
LDIWENPEILLGIPVLVIGLLGLAIVVVAAMIPERATAAVEAGAAPVHEGAHPGPEEYVRIGIALAIVTAIEVALYYIDLSQTVLILLLLFLSAVKFILVVLWFMHLKFDNRLFSTMFITGLIIAVSAFVVVLATLEAGLV